MKILQKSSLLTGVALGCLMTPMTASAQETDTIVVVGSAIRTPTAESDTTALPVQYVTRDQFEFTPAESVADFIRELPINTGSVSSSYNDESGGGRSSVNLRGVGDQYTLVLVDGRRLGGEDVPDISSIPPEAIEGIEVLKSGSSAIYGSDAVAGVVNIRLRKNFNGIELVNSYGQATRGGAETFRTGAIFGLSDGPFSFTGSISYLENQGFEKSERDIVSTRDFTRFGGLDRRSGFTGVPNRFEIDSGPNAGNDFSIDLDRFGPGSVISSTADLAPYNFDQQALSGNEIGVSPPEERYSGHWAAEYEILDEGRLNFYSRGIFERRTQEFIQQRTLVDVFMAADNPNNVLGEDLFAVYEFNPQFGINKRDSENTNFQGTVGFDGQIGKLNFDTAYTHYRSDQDTLVTGDADFEVAQELAESGEFDPFCYWCQPQDVYDRISPNIGLRDINTLKTFDFTLTGDLFEWSQGTVQFAAGYQRRDVEFDYRPNDALQNANLWWTDNLSDTPAVGDRSVDAYFGELKVPVFNAQEPAFLQSVELSGAVRNESYSDFGDATIWQGLARIGFLDGQVVARASFAETFRAPSIEALTIPQGETFVAASGLFDPVTQTTGTPFTFIFGGNPDLEAETGETFNAGLIIRPNTIPNLFLTFDYWTLDISNIIREPDVEALFAGTEVGGSLTRDPITNLPLVADLRLDNGGEFNVSGLDVSATYKLDTDIGDLSFYFNGTQLFEFEETGGGQTIEHLGEWSGAFGSVPETRLTTGVNWRNGPADAGLNIQHFSSV
ncbi:MAG: TonB-dependent receptor, partial [Pseudomonadota bacterium]